jgi:hypothetical protein
MHASVRPSRTLPAVLALVATMLFVGFAAVAQAQSNEPGEMNPGSTGDPGATVTSPPMSEDPMTGDGALHVQPVPGVTNARQVSIDHVALDADGKTLTVYWYGGVDTCYALEKVVAEPNADGVLVLTVFEGTLPGLPADQACIELAMLKATTITLEQPLFLDGSAIGG